MRIKRLFNEYQEISGAFKSHPYIIIKDVFGNPPERYLIEYKIAGLVFENDTIHKRDSHIVEIILPAEYPSAEPICRMPSPVFHPNIDLNKICIADYWAAGESLIDVIVRIGEIISYQNYNIKSPLNGEAAKWAGQNIHRFPIDAADLNIQKAAKEIAWIDTKTAAMEIEKPSLIRQECANCGNVSGDGSFHVCSNGHITCPDCSVECKKCGKTLCVLCPMNKCSICGDVYCDECKIICPNCGNTVCEEHLGECCVCQCGAQGKDIQFRKCASGHVACPDCILECGDCGKILCVSCNFSTCSKCGKIICDECSSVCPSCGKVNCKDHRDCCITNEQPVGNQIKFNPEDSSKIYPSDKQPVIQSVTCRACGHKIADSSAKFCEMCGNKI